MHASRGLPTIPNWPNDRGFVGGTPEPTGLIHLGARMYDATTGRFTSHEPVITTSDPQQLNGYAYAANNPVTNADPTELTFDPGSPKGCNTIYPSCPGYTPPTPQVLGYYLQTGNYGLVAADLGIPRKLLFPVASRPPLVPQLTGGPACYRFGYGCSWSPAPYYNNPQDGVGLALDWLSGIGNRHEYFNQWDPMTRQIAQDPFIAYIASRIKSIYLPGGVYAGKGSYADPANPVSLVEDLGLNYPWGTHLGHGHASTGASVGKSPVDGFLGSYDLRWAVVPTGGGTARVFFTATNLTDNNSGLYHLNSIFGNLDNRVGMFASVYQTYQWQVTIGS